MPSSDSKRGYKIALNLINSETVATLKRKLMSARDIAEPMSFFLKHFACDPEFRSLGRQRKKIPADLEAAVGQVAGAILQTDRLSMQWTLVEVSEYQFVHGFLLINGCQGTLIWLSDAECGILAINKSTTTGETVFARVSLVPEHKPN
jgi:hypothetical protein